MGLAERVDFLEKAVASERERTRALETLVLSIVMLFDADDQAFLREVLLGQLNSATAAKVHLSARAIADLLGALDGSLGSD